MDNLEPPSSLPRGDGGLLFHFIVSKILDAKLIPLYLKVLFSAEGIPLQTDFHFVVTKKRSPPGDLF